MVSYATALPRHLAGKKPTSVINLPWLGTMPTFADGFSVLFQGCVMCIWLECKEPSQACYLLSLGVVNFYGHFVLDSLKGGLKATTTVEWTKEIQKAFTDAKAALCIAGSPGRPFTIYTDYKPLTYASGQGGWWVDNFKEVKYLLHRYYDKQCEINAVVYYL
jgi:hypothetical protein